MRHNIKTVLDRLDEQGILRAVKDETTRLI